MARLSELTNELSALAHRRSFARAAVVLGRSLDDPLQASWRVKQQFPQDKAAAEIISKGAVTPTSTSSATSLAETVIESLATIMGPKSASGNVLSRALSLSLKRAASLKIPAATVASDTVFVGEGLPAKVRQFSFSDGPTLLLKKAVLIAALTRELIEHSDAVALVMDLLGRTYSLSLDAVLFSSAAATSTSPAGLLNGLSSVGATAGGSDNALTMDLGKLASAVAGVSGGSNDLVFVGGPAAAMKLAARLPMFKHPCFASSALADDTLVCLSPSCLAVAGGVDPPRISVSSTSVLHMEDASPAAFSTAGTPNVVSAPLRSLYQTDAAAIKLSADLDWSLRGGGCAFVSSVTW